MAAAGLSILAGCIFFLAVRPETIIADASEGLAGEFSTLAGKIGLGAGLTAIILLTIGYFCLIIYQRKAGKCCENDMEIKE